MPESDHQPIQATTNVDVLLDRFPAAVPVFVRRRLHCVGCPMARFETVIDVCAIYGLSVDEFLSDLRTSATSQRTDCDQSSSACGIWCGA